MNHNHKNNHICPIGGCNYVGRQWTSRSFGLTVGNKRLELNDLCATSLHCPTHRVALIYAGNEDMPPVSKRNMFNSKWRKIHSSK